MSCSIPIMPPMGKREVREPPIPPRKNLMRAFHHEKPMWMPTLYADSQLIMCKSNQDMMPDKTKAGQDRFGTRFFSRCCGRAEPFIPCFADEPGVDGVEIQAFNDIPGLMKQYGDRPVFEVCTDPNLIYDDTTTDEQSVARVHDIVDSCGAHSNPGSGAVLSITGHTRAQFTLAENEFYNYSPAKYAPLQK